MADTAPNKYTFNRLSVDAKLNVLAEAAFGKSSEWESIGDDGKPKEKESKGSPGGGTK